jgi:hypothetical protein
MMFHSETKPRRRVALPGLLFIFCANFLLTMPAVAQRGTGGIGIGGGDPMDEARQEAARMRRAQEYYEAGLKLYNEGKVIQAKTKLKAAVGLVGANGSGGAALQALKQIHDDGMKELDRVRKFYEEKKFVEAMDLASQTKSIYANLLSGLNVPLDLPNISTIAARMIEALEKNPAARADIQEHEAANRLNRIKTLERLATDDPTRLYDLYKAYRKIAKRFPDCPTGRDCLTQSEKLRSDAEIWRAIKQERTRRKIASALANIQMLETNGRSADAVAEMEKLQSRFPGKSRKHLEKMAEKPEPPAKNTDDG